MNTVVMNTWYNMIEWLKRRVLDILFVAFCVVALAQGIWASHDLDWPPDLDLFRDIAAAQGIADGHFLADPHYHGETIWYNPLVPAVVAVTAQATGLPINQVYSRAGAFFNILGPIAFYLMLVVLFDRPTALVSSVAFLFLAKAPPLVWATYSPWLYTVNFAQALFCFTITAYARSLRTTKLTWSVASGLLWGLTFLASTAPALLFGLISLSSAVFSLFGKPFFLKKRASHWHPITRFFLMAGIAFLVSTPFALSILWNYHLKIVNPAPGAWEHPSLILEAFRPYLLDVTIRSPSFWVALIGFFALILKKPAREARPILVVWFVVSCAYITYCLTVQFAADKGLHLYRIIPSWHALFYASLAHSIFFGIGAILLCQSITRHEKRRILAPEDHTMSMFIAAVAFSIAFVAYPDFSRNIKFRQSEELTFKFKVPGPVTTIRNNSNPNDVFLTSGFQGDFGDLGLLFVGPAGRKVVALSPYFSNPYVDWKVRAAASSKMLTCLLEGRSDDFQKLAASYGVTHTCIAPAIADRAEKASGRLLQRIYADDMIVLHRIRLNH